MQKSFKMNHYVSHFNYINEIECAHFYLSIKAFH